MKKFIVLFGLAPSLLFCSDDAQFDVVGVEVDTPGTTESRTKLRHENWDDKGYDDFLQKPIEQTAAASGTLVDQDGDDQYSSNMYGNQYDDQEVDDSVYDRDDSKIR